MRRWVTLLFVIFVLCLPMGASPNQARVAILCFHGYGASAESCDALKEALPQETFYARTMAWGSASEGDDRFRTLTRAQMLDDAILAVSKVRADRIVCIGTSLGSYMAALACPLSPRVIGIVLGQPANYPDAGFDSTPLSAAIDDADAHATLIAWRGMRLDPTQNTALNAISHCVCRVLVLASDEDDLVPAATSENYAAAAGHTGLLASLHGYGHSPSSEQWGETTRTLIRPWLEQLLRTTAFQTTRR